MTRLLYVIPSLDESGAEKQLSLLATHLPRPEFTCKVVVLTRGGPYEEALRAAGVEYEILHKRGKLDPWALWKLRRIIRDWKPDLIHTWLFAGNAYGRLVAGGKNGPPVVVSERCVDTWKSGWQKALDRRLISRTARLVGNGRGVVDFYRDLGYPEGVLRVVHNGIRSNPKVHPQRQEIRDEWTGKHAAPFIVGYVGRLAQQKRLPDLIWMIELLRCIRDDVFLVLVGEGPERNTLEKFVKDLRLEEKIRFLGHRKDIPELLNAFDAFALASDFEGQSNSLMEAMCAGLPVVVSDIAPNQELVTHGETGLVVPVGDRPQFCREVQRLCDSPELRQRLGQAARELMQNEFGIERMVEGYVNVYREVLAENSPPGSP